MVIYIIMILGVVFAFIGLYVFLKGDTRQGSFEASLPGGIKVKISSLALVVFCVGVGMIIYSATLTYQKMESVFKITPSEAPRPEGYIPPEAHVPHPQEGPGPVGEGYRAELDRRTGILHNIIGILEDSHGIRNEIRTYFTPRSSNALNIYRHNLNNDEFRDFRAIVDQLNENNGMIVSRLDGLEGALTRGFEEGAARFRSYESSFRRAYYAAREGGEVSDYDDYPEGFDDQVRIELEALEERLRSMPAN